MTRISILGQIFEVPEDLTILKAYEWAGFHLVRGVGCRGGFCGACGTVYRLAGDYRLHFALACQTVIQPDMILGPLAFFPAPRPDYSLDDLGSQGDALLELFPEIMRCFGCNTCTKSCPQEIDVLDYMAAAIRSDLPALANQSFDCIMCGLCVARCPAELAPPNVALLGRRIYGKYIAAPAAHLHRRVAEIASGAFRTGIEELKTLPQADLRARYEARSIEP